MKVLKFSEKDVHNYPTVHITKNRNRLRHYENVLFVKDGLNFELEFFNPMQNKVKAQIFINGSEIGSIVIKPGQRVYLERFLDEDKKFIFETYNVDMNNEKTQEAIKNNGLITVKYYKESFKNFNINDYITFGSSTITISNVNENKNYINSITTTNVNNSNYYSTSTLNNTTTNSTLFSNSTNSTFLNSTNNEKFLTGRIEKGEKSNQNLINDYSNFETFSFLTQEWKLAAKNMTVPRYRIYCKECGTRRRRMSFKFCPSCGEKF